MSDISDCIIKILADNGVSAEQKEIWTFAGKAENVIQLDFSKHDKVFEDKIAELENIINHKLGDWNKHGITYQEILDMKSENDKLKQRIDKLESKNNQLTESILRKETKIHELESKETEIQGEIDTSTPIDCANSLINHLTHLEAFLIAPERYERTFNIDDLEQIAEHLLVYCKHNKEVEK